MKHWIIILAILMVSSLAKAESRGPSTMGDEDPFPLSCVNFSGDWVADDSSTYDITQRSCIRLRVSMQLSEANYVTRQMTIVPDNKMRAIRGNEFSGNVRHRWNAKKNASMIETYRYMKYDGKEVYEVVLLELVNSGMALESTYRTIMPSRGEVKREYNQKIFRKAVN